MAKLEESATFTPTCQFTRGCVRSRSTLDEMSDGEYLSAL